jgi:hypothetical protein
MAKVPIYDPKYWHERAEEARGHAKRLADPKTKRRMLKMVEQYEKLAKRAERIRRGTSGYNSN